MSKPILDKDATRPGELVVPLPDRTDARLVFIGRIETPFKTREDCPRRGDDIDGPLCRILVDEPYAAGLKGLEAFQTIEVLYWMHRARRDLVTQCPRRDGEAVGIFALRSPLRPNPIATSLVRLVGIEGNVATVRGLDCLDGTPLVDLKPDRCAFATLATGKDA